MRPIQYFEILKQGFLITWKNKILWIFGLFVLLGSFPSGFNWIVNEKDKDSAQLDAMASFIVQHPGLFFAICSIALVLIVLFFILRLIGSAAIIKSVNNIAVYSQSTFSNIFSEAKSYAWHLFLLEFLIGITLAAVFIVMLVPIAFLFTLKAFVLGFLSLSIAILIAIPLFVIAYYLKRYGYFYVVLGKMNLQLALESAYNIFRKNIKESLLMGIISIALNIVIAIIVFACFFALALISAPFGIAAYFIFSKIGAIIVLIAVGIIGFLILIALFSWYTLFVESIWVLFFQQISLEKKENKEKEKAEAEIKIPSPEAV